MSNKVSVTSGVTQGFVLRPLLFILYINDLPENIKSQVRLFAVYLTVSSAQDSQVLQSDQTKYFEFNPSKCQVIAVSR